MNLRNYYKLIDDFLKSLIECDNWNKAILNVEIQPNVLSFNGVLQLEDSNEISLKTRPNETVKEATRQLHLTTAVSVGSRWNKFKLIIEKNNCIQRIFIWDEIWQSEIDNLNNNIKSQNPDYDMPKWQWEDTRILQENIFYALAQAAFESVKDIATWDKSILKIKRLEGNVGFESFYTVGNDVEVPISTEANYHTSLAVHELHKFMADTFGENSKWNRAIFTLYPENKIDIKYIWDDELQREVDRLNNETPPL